MIVGLTGNLGAGKTTVASMLARLGAKVLDADQIAHRFIGPHGPCFKPIVRNFGEGILTGGSIDRKKLAAIVFGDPEKLQTLNGIVHPHVIKEIRQAIVQYKDRRVPSETKPRVLVVEAALLIEAGLRKLVDIVIVVKAGRRLQVRRVVEERGTTPQEAAARIARQMSIREKMRYADIVVDNRGNLDQTKKQVEGIWQKLLQKNPKK